MKKTENTKMFDVIQVMEIAGQPFAGMNIAITGHLSKPRSEIEGLIRAGGGTTTSVINQLCTHLLTNLQWNGDAISSKFKKAQKYRVKIMTEDEFIDIIAKATNDNFS